MPDLAAAYTIGGRHDRVDSPPRVAEATDGGSDVVTSLGTIVPRLARCSVFKDRCAPARRDSPADAIRPQGDQAVYRDVVVRRPGATPGSPQPA